jgi:hypothetical protein
MSFDLQLVLVLVAIAAAVLRRRLNILVFTTNHLILIRAFQNLEQTGQPPAYFYLPPFLFDPSQIERASEVTGLATCLLLVAAAVPWRVETRKEPLTPLPSWVLWGIGIYFAFLFFSTRTILEAAYASADQGVYGASAGGIYVLAWALVAYELRRRVDAGEMSPLRAMGVVVLIVFFLDFLKGSTGLAAGVVVMSLFLILVPGYLLEGSGRELAAGDRRTLFRSAAIGAPLLAVMVFVVAFIRSARQHIATLGLERGALTALERLADLGSGETGEGIEASANGTQGAAHVLMCTFLYDSGLSREWRSVWGPIEYTFKPSVLVRPLGLERSREAAWELMDYFIHGGGINVFGELYWNGGFLCLGLVGGALVLFLLYVDVQARASWLWLALACAIGPGLLQGYGYGFAQVFRGVANGLLFLVPFLAYLRFLEWRGKQAKLAVARQQGPTSPPRARPIATPRDPSVASAPGR